MAEPDVPWRVQLAAHVTTAMIVFSALAALAMAVLVIDLRARWMLTGVSLGVVAFLVVLRQRSPARAAPGWALTGVMLAIVYAGMVFAGAIAGPALAAAVTTIFAGLFYSGRGFAVVIALEAAGIAAIAWAMSTGRLPSPPAEDVAFTSGRVWLRTLAISGLFLATCAIIVRKVVLRLEQALVQARAEVARREQAERERLLAQEAMLRAQKREAIGQVATGIAHDFNNLLAVVGSKTELVRRRLPEDAPERRELDVIADVVAGGAGLTRQLLLFSRRQVAQPEVFVVAERLRGLGRLLGTLAGEAVTIDWKLDARRLAVRLDPSQLEQVVMNLVLNARDACGERGGTITIASERVDEAGRVMVALSVADTGAGMDAETLARAFDPLFTTKAEGLGTGLGLSTVQTIARQAGGDASLASTPGRGTRVEVRFPAVEPPPETPAPAASPTRGAGVASPAAGRAVVLLVDDEPHLRRALAHILDDGGIDVHSVADGDEAVRRAAELPRLDGLLCDLSMPGMTGDEVVRRLRAARPGLPALLMSGYAEPTLELASLGAPAVQLLAKPFNPEKLVGAVRAMLAGGVTEPASR